MISFGNGCSFGAISGFAVAVGCCCVVMPPNPTGAVVVIAVVAVVVVLGFKPPNPVKRLVDVVAGVEKLKFSPVDAVEMAVAPNDNVGAAEDVLA